MLKSILKITAVSAVSVSLVGCSVSEQRVARYGTGGAAIGALAGTAIGSTPDAALAGAAIGALTGSVAGVAANQKRQMAQQSQLCSYRSGRGRLYQAPCSQAPRAPELCSYRSGRGRLYQAPCSQAPQTPELCTYQGRGGVLYKAPCYRR